MSQPETVIVIPTYNEAENIGTLLPAVLAAAPVRVLVVDDNSSDGTREITEKIKQKSGRVELLHRPGKAGLGAAYRAGLRHALEQGAERIGTMDGDWSHDPSVLPALIAALDAGADLAIGSRYVAGGSIGQWPFWRRFLSSGARVTARLMVGPVCQDFTSGFRLYRRSALERIPPESVLSNSYSYLLEMATLVRRVGLTVTEVPIHFIDRRGGHSKLPRNEIIRAVATLWRLRFGRR